MSNSNDPKSALNRLLSSSADAKKGDAKAAQFTARMQQADAPPPSAAEIFAKKMEAANAQKSTSAGQGLLNKVAQKSTPPTRPVAPVQPAVNPAAQSFKERMEALYKKQAEMTASLSTPAKSATAPASKGSILPPPATKIAGIAPKPVAPAPLSRPSSQSAAERPAFSRPVGATATAGTDASARPSMFEKKAPLFTATRTTNDSSIQRRTNTIVPTQAKGDVKITTEEFIEMRDFLYEQAGIYVPENRKYLMENRLSSRLRDLGLRNFHEYHKYLKFDNNRKTELNKLFENMTTNETSFFRNNPQLDIFRDKVLARVINEQRAKGQRKIHIWSAGCSSGEEPYTIAIIIHELLKNEVDSWDIKITANDLSLAMLDIARKGLYSEYALRTTPQEMVDKYFTKQDKMFKILPKVQKLVNFGQINLSSSEQIAKVERSQIVFCRNVIIYFDDEMKRHVISSFYDNLLPGGFLLIGHSESLHSISRAFVPEHFTGAIVYGKKS